MAGALARAALPNDVHIYAIDDGQRGLSALTALPHVGAVVPAADLELAEILLARLVRIAESRASGAANDARIVLLLDDLAALGLEALDIPAVIGDLPSVGDVTAPIRPGADKLKEALGGAGELLSPLKSLFGGA